MSTAGIVSPSQTTLHLQRAFKLALSMVLLYWLALWLNWDMPKYGALAIALISLDTTGASLQKGLMRIVGTTMGLAVGMLGLALFAQDSCLSLMYNAFYLVVVGYLMQASRYPYAWFVAGFLPTLVWATTYGKVDNAFHYATFRYLETTAGIAIYAVVSVIFWPRQAGDKLKGQGHDLWIGLQDLFDLYRCQLEEGELPPNASALRGKLAGITSQMLTTLQAAYLDTPSVASQKPAWESMRVNARAIGDAMEMWRQTIDDCRKLDLDRLLPQVHSALEKLRQRLTRIDGLWRVWAAGEEEADTTFGDGTLMDSLQLEVNRDVVADCSHLDRAALLSFVQQLNVLDLTSREILRTMRVLTGSIPVRDLKSQTLPVDLHRPSRWDPVRLINGLLPAVCFTVGYFFWIFFDPPTGPSVPNMAVIFGLMVLLTPMRMLNLLPVLFVVICGLVAPVYFLVMPNLSTGLELLLLVFAYAFTCSLLSGRLAPLGALGLPLFVMLTGISNQQNYSFMGLVDGAQMMMMGVGIVAVVQTLLSPSRPEKVLLRSVHRFFRGCARVTSRFAAGRSKGRRLRRRYLESMVLPAPARILTAQKNLDYRLYPDNSPEKVQRLHDSVQSIAYRLESLEIAHDRIEGHSADLPESVTPLGKQVSEPLNRLFERWASLEPGDQFEQQRRLLQHLSRDLQKQFDTLARGGNQATISDRALTDLYTMLGCVRGLITAMAHAQGVINQINWRQWAMARF